MSQKPLMEGWWGVTGWEGDHIKEIHQRPNFGSTWASFHFCHVPEHLAPTTLVLSHLLLLQLAANTPPLPRRPVTDSIRAANEIFFSTSEHLLLLSS